MENLTTNSDSNNNNMNISSESFMRKSNNSGIKFLLNIRNFKTEELENDEFVKENKKLLQEEDYRDQYEKIDDDYYNKHLNDMDEFIKDIKSTKDNLKMSKLKETVKTREDIMNFYNIKDSNNFKYAPEPIIRDANYIKNLNLKDTEAHQKNKEFKDIQSIINNQNHNMKGIEFVKPEEFNNFNNFNSNNNNISIKESMFPTSIKFKNDLDTKFNNDFPDCQKDKKNKEDFPHKGKNFEFSNPIMNRNSYNLTEEERNFMNKYVYNDEDDLMDELDDCIKLGDEIDDYIKYVEK